MVVRDDFYRGGASGCRTNTGINSVDRDGERTDEL